MTCHCSSKEEHASRAVSYANDSARATESRLQSELATLRAKVTQQTTNTTNYQIERVEQVGAHLVVQARYPNCEHRAYEGLKTMVFLKTSALDALKWKSIDPHFRGEKFVGGATGLVPAPAKPAEAPSPAARFPGDVAGWADAVTYARGKETPR